ncbi:MAG TPA: choice-of-anchor J domain-containing protein [Solirubrobacteraceae bacterium]|nr:choice-of-anchor J domain-containing protein [Solirubrobacteraceae bacterium]
MSARSRRALVSASALALFVLAVPAATANAAGPAPGTVETGPDYNKGKPLPWRAAPRVTPARLGARFAARASRARRARARITAVGERPVVGTVKSWPALDDAEGLIYLKDYTLRAVGEHIEVWVANDIQFPANDCRNGARTVVTDAQAQYLAREFDTNIYPKESEAFSVPPRRDGSGAEPIEGIPAGYFGGEGDDIVTLVDNVRDANFYDPNNSRNLPYIAGFFFSVFNEVVDRNVMTIDAFDWLHRTTANPPNEPVPGDNCRNANARPFLYEGTFAHEYQHLLENVEDPDEVNWVNEGLSDWAQTLTGYANPRVPITDIGFDSHVQCFLGFLGVQTPANPLPRPGGPENSLNLWGDQGEEQILCDYGAAYTMMELLHGRYGEAFMTALHRGDANGFEGLRAALARVGSADTPASILRDWAATAALDGVLDRGAELVGRARARLRTPTLDASINWATPEAFDTPGAPPNGSDYVRLRNGAGGFIDAGGLRSLTFDGAEALEPKPVEWTVDANPPAHAGNAALFSGSGPNFDRAIVRSVAVPAASPTLTFQTQFETEPGFDFGFVQVSTDGGRTYTSLANANTTTSADPGAIPTVVDNLPGLTGSSSGWRTESFDLSAYAGQTVLLAFRYVTDSGVDGPGWWIDDVTVGGAALGDGTTLDGWQTPTQVSPVPVAGYTVQLVGYTSATLTRPAAGDGAPAGQARRGEAFAIRLRLDAANRIALNARQIDRLLGDADRPDVVAVLVMQNDPTELVDAYARYTLIANGVVQPGGGTAVAAR